MKYSQLAGLAGLILPWASLVQAQPIKQTEQLIWGVQAEQLEIRALDDEEVLVWDFDALIGTDELKLVWRSEAEYGLSSDEFESLENQLRLRFPISTFFNGVV